MTYFTQHLQRGGGRTPRAATLALATESGGARPGVAAARGRSSQICRVTDAGGLVKAPLHRSEVFYSKLVGLLA